MSMIRSKNSENELVKQAQTIEEWMQTGSTAASSFSYRSQQRQLNHENYENQATFLGQPIGVVDLKSNQYQKRRRHSSSRELHSANRNRRRSRPSHKMEHVNGKPRHHRKQRRSTQITEYDDSIDSGPRTLQLLSHQEEHALVPYVENHSPGNDGALVLYSERRSQSSQEYKSSKALQLHSEENHQDLESSFNTRTAKDPDGKMDWEAFSATKKKISRKKRESRANDAKMEYRPSKSTYQVRERTILDV